MRSRRAGTWLTTTTRLDRTNNLLCMIYLPFIQLLRPLSYHMTITGV